MIDILAVAASLNMSCVESNLPTRIARKTISLHPLRESRTAHSRKSEGPYYLPA